MSVFRIRRKTDPIYIRSEIDSGGMSVTLTEKRLGDTFDTYDEADAFRKRVIERYPDEQLKIEAS